MLDGKALASIPLVPANTAPPAPAYSWPAPYTAARSIFPKEHVLSLCSGRPTRLHLPYAKSCPDLWITTGESIAANFMQHERAAL